MTKFLRLTTTSVLALSLAAGPVGSASFAQTVAPAPVAMQDVVINMRGADIKDVAEQVSRIAKGCRHPRRIRTVGVALEQRLEL